MENETTYDEEEGRAGEPESVFTPPPFPQRQVTTKVVRHYGHEVLVTASTSARSPGTRTGPGGP